MLTTNLFKKEFSSNQNQYEVGLAANCLANIATKELARDCISDLVTLMNHTKPYIRKKAILAMYKLYIKFPQGLRLTFDKLKERLDDPESSVISTAVNVICELANKNPKNYLAMAPKFFKLLTTSSNNWMLIKVVKLLGSLVSEEPRLARKLLDPLATIIRNTSAKSLQYECIYTITEALPYSKREDGSDAKNAVEVIKVCSEYLRGFIEDADQNLKYLGLVGLCNLMKSSPRSVVDHRDLVLGCLNDDDVTIRTKALELLAGIASKKSLVDLVHHLLDHAKRSEGSYRDEIILKILWMCRRDKYGLVTDFAWYTSILLDLAVMQGSKHGLEVADQLMEIALRVDTVRPYAVETMLSMLLNENLTLGHARATVVEVLRAAAWIIGEYSDIVSSIANDHAPDRDEDSSDSDSEEESQDDGAYWIEGATGEEMRSLWRAQPLHFLVIKVLLHARATTLPAKVQMVYLQAAMKLFARSCTDCAFSQVADIIGLLRTGLPHFMQNLDLEVQERATSLRYLLADLNILSLDWEKNTALVKVADEEESKGGNHALNLLDLMPVYEASSVRTVDETGARVAMQQQAVLAALIKEKFYAVHSKAQRKVPVPEGLDLQQAFNASAMAKLMKTELPDNLSLGTLVFVKEREVPGSYSAASSSKSAADVEDSKLSKVLQNSFGNAFDDIFMSDYSSNHNHNHNHVSSSASVSTGMTSKGSVPSHYNAPNSADDVFMLGSSKKNADLVPLSRLLGELADSDLPQVSHKRRSKEQKKKDKEKEKEKKSSSSGRRKNAQQNSNNLDAREMLPAGAISSGEEDSNDHGRRGRKRRDSEDVDLDGIDITRPLDESEVLPVQTHRVVPATVAVEDDKSKKKDKKHKKDKEKDKKKDGSDQKAAAESQDLLTLDWAAPSSASPLPPSSSVSTSDLLGGHETLLSSDLVAMSSSGDAKKEKKVKKDKERNVAADSNINMPAYVHSFYIGRAAEIRYGVVLSGAQAVVIFETQNLSTSAIQASVEIQPHALLRQIQPRSLDLARQLAPQQQHRVSTTLTLAHDSTLTSQSVLTLSAALQLTSEGLIGPDTLHVSVPVHLYATAAFQPYKLDTSALADKLGKASSKWAKKAATIVLQSKPKLAFRRLCDLLCGYLVEAESSKAATIAAKTVGGAKVFVLCKASSSTGTATVEAKALGASEAESQAAVAAVIAAVEGESL